MLTNILNSQPQGHPQINWGNPIARGLVAVVIDGVFNPVNDRPYTLGAGFSGAMSRAYSPQGVALSVDGPSNPTATITLQTSGLDTRSFSVAGKIRTRAVGGAGVGARAGTGNIVLWRNTGWDCRIGGTDYTAGGTYNLNEVYDYALTSSASAVGLYVNGQSVISGGAGGAGTLSDMQMFVDGAGGGSHFLDVWWFGVWNRPLTALEVQELRVNPWQIFDSAPSIPLIGIAAAGGTTITCTLGTASAVGYQSAVAQGTAIACALGTATAQGYQAQIAQGTSIVCALGTATASGYAAQVSQGTSIACSMGTATATGYQAAISSGGVVACSLGTASAIGYRATVSAATVISCALGTATASGYQAQISDGTVINGSPGVASALGYTASISASTLIACGLGTASAVGYSATVSTIAALVASPDYIGRHTARNFSTARHRTRNFSTAT